MLIDDVQTILTRLSTKGWADTFSRHGLDITAPDLAGALSQALTGIDQNQPGFGDLSPACQRGVEPGKPAESLLFHGLASPAVTAGITEFPTLADLDIVENYIYSLVNLNLSGLTQLAASHQGEMGSTITSELSVVMMATEYRTADQTVHGLHADMVYSRTGVARAGTLTPSYDGEARGFWPASDTNGIHVIPCQWKPFLCTRIRLNAGNANAPDGFGPLNHLQSDFTVDFWVPIHKLFSGTECISGQSLSLDWSTHHENTKIGRIHQFLDGMNVASNSNFADFNAEPYKITQGLAVLSNQPDLPDGTLIPEAKSALVEIAKNPDGSIVTFPVPRGKTTQFGRIALFWSSLEMRSTSNGRFAPEYVHVRHIVDGAGNVQSLNEDQDLMQLVRGGGYEAVHYMDFTGAGFVTVNVKGIGQALDVKPGFSIIAAPDFYPKVDQRKVRDWLADLSQTDRRLARHVGWGADPQALAFVRIPPDPGLDDGVHRPFSNLHSDGTETTISALVTQPGLNRQPATEVFEFDVMRCPVLSDAAAGVFAPGWAISTDTTDGKTHLAAYGLGSPFPEDAKLCAALSAFWPAAAPDTTRTYQPTAASTAPMLDSEITGDQAWDGVQGATRVSDTFTNYPDKDFSDYVESALSGSFDMRLTAELSFEEYIRRVRRTAQIREYLSFSGIGAGFETQNLVLLQFQKIGGTDQKVRNILNDTGLDLSNSPYFFVLANLRNPRRDQTDHKRLRRSIEASVEFVADDGAVVHKQGPNWARLDIPFFA